MTAVALLVILASVAVVLLLLAKLRLPKVATRDRPADLDPIPQAETALALSAEGLFYIFAPSKSNPVITDLDEKIFVVNPDLTRYQLDYGPVDIPSLDDFASRSRHCNSSREVAVPVGAVSAFAAIEAEPSSDNQHLRLTRIDGIGYEGFCAYPSSPFTHVYGALLLVSGEVVAARFYVRTPGLRSIRNSLSPANSVNYYGLMHHAAGSDEFWACQKLQFLVEGLEWARSVDEKLQEKFKELRRLAKQAQGNPLMVDNRSNINSSLLEVTALCDQLPEILSDLETSARHIIEWINLPSSFKSGLPYGHEDWQLERIAAAKEKFQDMVELIDLR